MKNDKNDTPSYRPHNPGHDYYAPGVYLITLVVRDRARQSTIFGRLNDDAKSPGVFLSPVGEAVLSCWEAIPRYQAAKGRKLRVHRAVCMPDHFHGVIEVLERMDKNLGEVIRGFKVGCTKEWRRLCDCPSVANPEVASMGASSCLSLPSVEPSCLSLPSVAASSCLSLPSVAASSCLSQPSVAASSCLSQPSVEPSCPSQPCIASSSSLSQPYLDESSILGTDEEMGREEMEREMLQRMSKKQRAAYYASHPSVRQPLWDDNYDDTICLSDPVTGAYDQRHLSAMLAYVADNPRRAIMRHIHPDYMQRCLHVVIRTKDSAGRQIERDYAAFGNLFLLRWPRKVQVFCHRKARISQLTDSEREAHGYRGTYAPDFVTSVPYEHTEAFREECRAWKRQVMNGATVIVTPGISKGELLIRNRCIESRYPLIHIQKEPIGRYWKPELSRFDACVSGSLLILAPWHPDALGDVNGVPSATDYSVFHNLNRLASELVEWEVEGAKVSM